MAADGGKAPEQGLLQQGDTGVFNQCRAVISGNYIYGYRTGSTTDAYNVKRYLNLSKFSDNTTTGTGNSANISNKHSGFVIPSGASCSFSVSGVTGGVGTANYAYIAVLLRDTGTGNIARIGLTGQNRPAATQSFTAQNDTEIGCIALEYSHTPGNRTFDGYLSLVVNGEEWL